jgi:hypothetical protein
VTLPPVLGGEPRLPRPDRPESTRSGVPTFDRVAGTTEEGYPAAEVARLIGVSPATVRVHLHRARKRLRELLGSEEDD